MKSELELDAETRAGRDASPYYGEASVGSHVPSLDELTAESRRRLIGFIVSSTLGGGVAPTAVIALYADLAGDEPAVRYADYRFTLRQVPPDWRTVEDRVLDLEAAARARGVDLARVWQRAMSVAVDSEDPVEHLARLAGLPADARVAQRSIFDDPEDLDELDTADESLYAEMAGRLPDLVDLELAAQARIRRFAIEERLEHGLPAIELLELYRTFEVAGDDRARQYLDRVYVERVPPPDWTDLQADAQRVLDLAESRGRDAGRVYADLLQSSPGIDPLVALQMVAERLGM